MLSTSSKRGRPRYVLIVEENSHHAELITEVLDRNFAPVIIHTVDTIDDGIEFATQASYDLILTAAIVGDTPIPEMIPKLSRAAEGAPIIVISGRADEKLAAEFIKKGAAEYVSKTKESLDNLPALLAKHFAKKREGKRRKTTRRGSDRPGAPTPEAIIREVDRLTQQALAVAGPRRRKRRNYPHDIEQLDRLLGQIQRLRELASKLTPKG